jgi:hypothetical protein
VERPARELIGRQAEGRPRYLTSSSRALHGRVRDAQPSVAEEPQVRKTEATRLWTPPPDVRLPGGETRRTAACAEDRRARRAEVQSRAPDAASGAGLERATRPAVERFARSGRDAVRAPRRGGRSPAHSTRPNQPRPLRPRRPRGLLSFTKRQRRRRPWPSGSGAT